MPDTTQAMPALVVSSELPARTDESRDRLRPDDDISTLQRPPAFDVLTAAARPHAAASQPAPPPSAPLAPVAREPSRRVSLGVLILVAVALMFLGFAVVAVGLRFVH
ncbi:MAG: hypothetical protein EBR06_06445 [Acidimicrobiia bacterium]|nr:hypothetical protein [Acidimicrobiia bacterium]